MNKLNKWSFIVGLPIIAWLVWAITRPSINWDETRYATGIVMTVISFIAAEIYLIGFRTPPDRDTVEIAAVPVVLTIVYIILVLILNTILVFYHKGRAVELLVMLNAILLLLYACTVYFAERSIRNLKGRINRSSHAAHKSAGFYEEQNKR